MRESVKNLLEKLHMTLDNYPAQNEHEEKLHVLLLGMPYYNLCSFLPLVDAEFAPLNRTLRKGYSLTLDYGDSLTVVHQTAESAEPLELKDAAGILTDLSDSETECRFRMTVNHPAFRNVVLDIVASDDDYTDIAPQKLLETYDYIIFSLNTGMLLSTKERRILQSWFMRYAESCLGILLSNYHMLRQDEMGDVQEVLDAFFTQEIPFFHTVGLEEEKLLQALASLEDRHQELRDKRNNRIEALALGAALEQVMQKEQLLQEAVETVDAACRELERKYEQLPARKEVACKQFRLENLMPLRVQINERLTRSCNEVQESIRLLCSQETSSGSVPSADELRVRLPELVTDGWEQKRVQLSELLIAEDEELAKRQERFLKEQIQQFLEDTDALEKIQRYLSETQPVEMVDSIQQEHKLYADEGAFSNTKTVDHSKSIKYGSIIAGAAVGLTGSPILGLATALVGSKVLAKKEKKRYEAETTSALMEIAQTENLLIYEDYQKLLAAEMDEWEAKAFETIKRVFDMTMENLQECVQTEQGKREEHEKQLEEVCSLREQIHAQMEHLKNE